MPIYCSSQNISKVIITSDQLRTANTIFIEHAKFSKEVPLLKLKVDNLEKMNSNWKNTDSIRKIQLIKCNNIIQDQNKSIKDLQKSLRKKHKIINFGITGSIIVLLSCLLIK